MAALSRGGDLIPAFRRLGTAAFQVIGTWTAEPWPLLHALVVRAACWGGGFAHGKDFYADSVDAMLQPALRQRYSQTPATVQYVFGAENARGPGSPESPTTTVVGLVSTQRCSSRAGSRRFLLMTGHAEAASLKHGTSSINYERALQYRVRGAPVPTTRNRGTRGVMIPVDGETHRSGRIKSCHVSIRISSVSSALMRC